MKTLLWPAMLVGMLAASAPAEAQTDPPARECVGCERASEIEARLAAMGTTCDQPRFDAEQDLLRALRQCNNRAHECGVVLDDALGLLAQCAPRVIARSSDPLCERQCEGGGHGTWHDADPSASVRSHRERGWCEPASGYRIVGRCRPVVRPRTPRTGTTGTGGSGRADPPRTSPVLEALCGRFDGDRDGVPDMHWVEVEGGRECVPYDNCPDVANADQTLDRDNDGFGDACDVRDDLVRWRELLAEHCADRPDHRLCRDAPAIVGTDDDPPAEALPDIEVRLSELCTASGDDDLFVCSELRRLSAEVVDLHDQDRLLLSRSDCHDRGRRVQGIVTDERREGSEVVREDRVVCAEECIIEGARYNAETQRCELPPERRTGGPRIEAERLELDVGPYYSFLSDTAHMVGLEASLSIPLGTEAVRIRPYLAAGYAFGNSHFDGDTFVGLGGADLEFELFENDDVSFSVGVGPYVLGTVATGQTRWPFASYGGAATLRLEIGNGPLRFGAFVRGNVGGCDTAWGPGITVCGGVTAGIGFHAEF